jgi:hypothetical protein
MEIFKAIEGYDGVYEISSYGNVISNCFGKRKELKQGIMTSGYKMIVLKKDGKQKSLSVHRLVAIHFLPNNDCLEQVNHIDGDKLNNNLSNLEWCTRSQNIKHMYDKGLKTYRPLHYKGKFGKDHNRSKSVICIETGIEYGSMSEAARKLKINYSSVSWSIKHKKPIFGMHFEIKE